LAAAVEWVKAALIVCQTHGTEISAIGDGKLTGTVSPAFVAALGFPFRIPLRFRPKSEPIPNQKDQRDQKRSEEIFNYLACAA